MPWIAYGRNMLGGVHGRCAVHGTRDRAGEARGRIREPQSHGRRGDRQGRSDHRAGVSRDVRRIARREERVAALHAVARRGDVVRHA